MANKPKAGPKALRGFALLPKEQLREICRKGGLAMPAEKRSFSKDPELARRAGQIGGRSIPAGKRSFSKDKALASAAGRAGGLKSGRGRRG